MPPRHLRQLDKAPQRWPRELNAAWDKLPLEVRDTVECQLAADEANMGGVAGCAATVWAAAVYREIPRQRPSASFQEVPTPTLLRRPAGEK
jgi:hypothetical protein